MNEQRAPEAVAITAKGNVMTLTEGLYLESKLPIDPRISAKPVEIDGLAGWTMTIGDLPHWVRLRIAIDVGADLLAIRLLLRVDRDDALEAARLRVMLAKTQIGTHYRAAVPKTSADLWVERSGIYAVTGLCACAVEGENRLELLVNLPNECSVSVLSVDLSRRDAELTPAARERISASGAEMLAPFTLSLATTTAAFAPIPLLQKTVLSGLNLTGHVITTLPQTSHVRVVAGNMTRILSADCSVEIGEGIRSACGFNCALFEIAVDGTPVLEFFLEDGLDTPNWKVEIPPHLLSVVRALQGCTVQPKDLPPSGTSELFFFPDYTATNPYQTLMYRHMPRVVARAGTLSDAVARLEAGAPSGAVIMHLHWLHVLVASSVNEAEARQKRRTFRGLLRHFIRLGGIVLWTVHNTVSHDAKYRDVEIAIGQDVSRLAHRIHVHSESLLPILAECYDLPATKLVIEPHPNYVGVYLDYSPQQAARARLALPQDAKVFLFIGQLRLYKGIENLVQVFAKVAAENPDTWLLIAGKPVNPYAPGMVTRLVQSYGNVRVIESYISDSDLHWFYRAADWVTLPYTNILTSGSLLCAMSFSRPCIAPRLGMIGDVVKHGHNGLLYDPEDPHGLEAALTLALATDSDRLVQMQSAAFAAVQPLTWDKLGQRLDEACDTVRQVRRVPLSFETGILDCELLGPSFPPERPARTAVIILNYEHIDDVQRLVGSLRESTNQDFDLYVVDNASPNLTPIELSCDLEGLRILCIPENMGYAAGNNAAMRLIADLHYEFIWILNPDMVVMPQALDGLITAAAAYPEHAIFGPAILRGSNDQQIASAGCFVTFENGMATGHLYAGENVEILPKGPFEVDFITGASIFLRKSALDVIGLIPEDYFLYFEETQWLLEAAKNGLKSLVVPNVKVTHYKRSEDDGLPAKYYFYYYLRNSLLFYSRMTRRDPNSLQNTLLSGFVATWLEKIEARRPAALELYRRLANRALSDGMAGQSGRIDLQALEFDLLNPDRSAVPFIARSKLTIQNDGILAVIISVVGERLPEALVTVLVNGRGLGDYPGQLDYEEEGIQQWSLSVQLPTACHRDVSVQIECRLNGRRLEGGRLKAFLPLLPPSYQGRIDGIASLLCSGWALNNNYFEDKLEVEIIYEGRVVARTIADIPRSDLLKKGVGDGVAGFRVRMPQMFSDGSKRKIGLRVAGSHALLFEREVVDNVIAGGALPQPAFIALDDLFYNRQLWLARHGLSELPLGQLASKAQAMLASRYASRPESELVSIIMPAFNRQATIVQAMASVLAQSYANWELLIVDDGSKDRTVEVIEDFIKQSGDDRIVLIVLPENQGISPARNVALQAARGEIIAYLDSDNTWAPDFLRIMAGELMRQPKPGSAYCGQNILQVCGAPEDQIEETIALRMAPIHLPLLENRNYIDLNCFVHHRRLYETLGGFSERLQRLVDWEIILRFARVETPHFVPALLSNYYFDKAENQITKLANFDDNMRAFDELARQHPRKPVPSLQPRQVDIALIGAPGQELRFLIQRACTILGTLGKHDPVRILLCPARGTDIAGAALPPAIELVAAAGEKDAAETGTVLSVLLDRRRPESDLIVMRAQAMPQHGWLMHFNAAVAACSNGGIFISRHMILAQHVPQHAKRIPYARAQHDACIALPADHRIILDPQLDPELNLIEISQADLFCTYFKQDYLVALHAAATGVPDEDAQVILTSQLLRLAYRCKIVYCGDVEVYEL